MFNNLKSRVKSTIKDQQLRSAKRCLESDISKIINLVEGHKAAGLPAGHPYYKLLLDKANESISRLISRYNELGEKSFTREDVLAGVPAFRGIEELANSSGSSPLNPQIIGVVFTVGLALTVGGTIVATLCQVVHHYLVHFLVK